MNINHNRLGVLVLVGLLSSGAMARAQDAEFSAQYRLEGAALAPGAEAQLPFYVMGSGKVGGFAASADFDEEVLEVSEIARVWQRPSGEQAWDFFAVAIDSNNSAPGNGGVDEGYIVVAAVFTFFGPDDAMPAGEEVHALDVTVTVRPEAPPGSTEIVFVDGAPSPGGVPTENYVAVWVGDGGVIGGAPQVEVTPVFISALLSVIGEREFLRGDANSDSSLDVSDAIATLNFLFAGGSPLACLDAADANDDGQVDVSDPLKTFGHLFQGGALPPPVDEPGIDPTEDELDCAASVFG